MLRHAPGLYRNQDKPTGCTHCCVDSDILLCVIQPTALFTVRDPLPANQRTAYSALSRPVIDGVRNELPMLLSQRNPPVKDPQKNPDMLTTFPVYSHRSSHKHRPPEVQPSLTSHRVNQDSWRSCSSCGHHLGTNPEALRKKEEALSLLVGHNTLQNTTIAGAHS